MTSLKDFIKKVRAAKTIADERTVIQKESAAIRTSFRENDTDNHVRKQNVAKLLYLFTLGERTHFGQVECLKLLATSKFSDKRLGYLGTMLLLDENQEVLTLLTNSLNQDLSHPNQYIVSLALCTLGNIASTEMARDLFADIEKLIVSSNSYLRRKAAICAMRIIRKVPELEENYVDKAKLLLGDKSHGVLLCAMALVTDICINNPDQIPNFRQSLPLLIKQLEAVIQSGYDPEHDVTGIPDPFLQVKILRLMRILGAGDAQSSEMMSDILTSIASKTDSTKNVGNAVLYEAVQTIFSIEADPGLRVLGVTILGKFLSNRDNNTRYVALNTLLQVIEREPIAVQRHRATIIQCLQDSDISIRRRALELSYELVNEQNVRALTRDLLSFLETADTEFKAKLTSQIAIAAEKYAPNRRWHIDTIIRMLKIAGGYTQENVLSSFVVLVMNSEDLQLYTVQKLYASVRNDFTQEGLTLAATWLIGEYGNVLLQGGSFNDEDQPVEVSPAAIVDVLESILNSSYATEVVKEYVLNALMKLTTRVGQNPSIIERIRLLLQKNAMDLDTEIQQRVAEYSTLFKYDSVRVGVLERMPAPEMAQELSKRYEEEKKKKDVKRNPLRSVTANLSTGGSTGKSSVAVKNNGGAGASAGDLLLDLMGDDDSSAGAGGAGNGVSAAPSAAPQKNNIDLLSDLFGGSGDNGSSTSTGNGGSTNSAPAKPANQSILDLFGNSPAAPSSVPVSAPAPTPVRSTAPFSSTLGIGEIEAYSRGSLRLTLEPIRKEEPGSVVIVARFHNDGGLGSPEISNINLQVAIPKGQKLTMKALSGGGLVVAGSGPVTQELKIAGTPGGNVKLRMRLSYSVGGGEEVKDQVDFAKFPEGLL
ncbi:uncharacterized protein SAPINGB_P004922 [Magnusiomyces paraingens]|uniref:AP-1 complex subunit gamma n=1 Tax=Magnusiomyces paraingens TaxID=2606893 RepID=A0A5E8BXS3_9ASCO|nr:uncharacterized protein SAPINGB_P004922 [Saprochaete ingens]VVT56264.1 unnamed protein product [Saprochaete ingens]